MFSWQSYEVKLLALCVKVKATFRHENVYGNEGTAPPFLTSMNDKGEWPASRPVRFTHHWLGGWLGTRVGLNTVGNERNYLSVPGIKLQPSSP